MHYNCQNIFPIVIFFREHHYALEVVTLSYIFYFDNADSGHLIVFFYLNVWLWNDIWLDGQSSDIFDKMCHAKASCTKIHSNRLHRFSLVVFFFSFKMNTFLVATSIFKLSFAIPTFENTICLDSKVTVALYSYVMI